MALSWSSNGMGVSSNPYAVDYSSPYNIPGLSDALNALRNQSITDYQKQQKLSQNFTQTAVGSITRDYLAAQQQVDAENNAAIKNLYATLDATKGGPDNFLGNQVGMLAQSGLDSTVVTAFAAAGAKSGVDSYETVLARANKALSLQQQYLDQVQTVPVAGRSNTETLKNLLSNDINGAYANTLSSTVGDLVSQLSDVQKLRQEYASQANALMGASQIANNTETAKILMGLDKAQESPEQSTAVQVDDVSPRKTNANQSGAALDSRGGGRYVTTTSAGASGLRI